MMQVTGKKRALFSFSRWMRKGYAVFRSLGREVRIAVLSVVYSIVVVPGAVWAQTSADTLRMREVDLEEVVVTAGRTPVGAQQVARMVTTLSRVEVERVPAQSISELLRVLPSADIRQRGPLGAQADISVRGGSFDQTLVLLNGINVSDPQTGHHHLNLPVDPESISRVEFLTGPAARAFGPNAFNGVINLITGPPSKTTSACRHRPGPTAFSGSAATLPWAHVKQAISSPRGTPLLQDTSLTRISGAPPFSIVQKASFARGPSLSRQVWETAASGPTVFIPSVIPTSLRLQKHASSVRDS